MDYGELERQMFGGRLSLSLMAEKISETGPAERILEILVSGH